MGRPPNFMPESIVEPLAFLQMDAQQPTKVIDTDVFNTLRMVLAIEGILGLELRFLYLLPKLYFPCKFPACLKALLAARFDLMHFNTYSIHFPLSLKSSFDLY
jgi:hypothetical protein